MESDGDDFELYVSAESNSPPICGRRLKRLKKAVDVAVKSPCNPSDAGYESFFESEEPSLERPLVPEPDDEDEDSSFQQESAVAEGECLGFEGGEEGNEVSVVGVKRALEFDSSDEEESEVRRDCEGGEEGKEGAVGIGDYGGRVGVGDGGNDDKVEKKKKKKKEQRKSRVKRSGKFDVGNKDGDSVEEDTYAVAKRVSEKVRRNQLTHLRADSQRLLRESSDTGFKPVPLVHKPISSVLEKIRQRKLELAKKTVPANKSSFSFPFPDLMGDDIGLIVDNKEIGTKAESRAAKVISRNSVASSSIHAEINANTLHVDESIDALSKTNHVDVPSQAEGIKQLYRSPVDDTQNLLSDSESDHSKDDLAENPQRLTEEVFSPSLLAMNLKLDSAPQDESSDEDDHDKENIDPLLHQSDYFSIASLGDPVKNLIDVEAEEEDDSDNDMIRFQENEEEDSEDLEELNDMIAPDFKEGDADRERRNELHQKWLEQQDATRTENLLQRLNCGPKKTTAGLVDLMDDGEDGAQNEDEIEELSEDDVEPGNVARINFRKVQQMIPQMFTDNDESYVSSEDEEFEKRLAKQNLLLKTEFQGSLVSPAEDENSREVFRLIKKLNIVSHNKKRAKSSVLHDNTLLGGRPNELLKPSFLGRGSTSLPSSKNRKTSSFKAFIFGRDDSNSKSAISTCEDSDMIDPEAKSARTSSSAKLRSSQSRHSSQATTDSAAVAASSTTSLYDILRRSSMQSEQCSRSGSVDQPKSIFSAFRVVSKSKEGRVRM